jgi:hypothetical protein
VDFDLLIKIVVFAAVAYLFWLACQPRCAFVVRITEGIPRTIQGTTTPAFLAEVRELCAQHGIQRGTVRGLVRGKLISLAFSRDIPPAAQQQLRNWWAISGWGAPMTRA